MTLETHPFLQPFPPEVRTGLLAAAEVRAYEAGQMVFDEGSDPHNLYLVLEGGAEFQKRFDARTFQPVGTATPGAHFGELGLIDGNPRSLRVICPGPSRLAVVPGTAVIEALAVSPGRLSLDIMSNVVGMLRRTMLSFTDAAVARQRMESELKIASEIQTGLLPQPFQDPATPERAVIEGFLEQAREVGGDLYDYFLIDENRLCFLVADVCDKGVHAALFSAAAATLVQEIAFHESSSAKILSRLNDRLAENNPRDMFLTAFLGVLHLDTGVLSCTRGGHEMPVLMRADGSIERLEGVQGSLVGTIPGILYQEQVITLGHGDTVVLFTDGVSEAMNLAHEQFGVDRLISTIRSVPRPAAPAALNKAILEAIHLHVNEAPQSDDITLLTVTWK